jgi:cell division protease FtsH
MLIFFIFRGFRILIIHEIWVEHEREPCPTAIGSPAQGQGGGHFHPGTVYCRQLKEPDESGKKIVIANRVDPKLAEQLSRYNVAYTQVYESKFLATLLSWVVPALVFFGIWILIFRKFIDKQGGMGGGFMNIG